MIKRDALLKENGKYYISINRIKMKLNNTKNNDFHKDFEINESLYRLIKNYIKMTNKYGKSETLISYRSLMFSDRTNLRFKQKRDHDFFNRNILSVLLTRFYNQVLKKYYQINIPLKQRLSPNSTRHIAFVSLMMQGIPPIEIARIGGHNTIAAQYHYSFHKEYWIDNEVFKLLENYKNISNLNKNNIEHIPDKIKLKAFEPPTSNFKGELEIGYCSDYLIRCEAKECMNCSHWRVELDDLQQKHDLIINKINTNRNSLIELMNFFYKLHTKSILKNTELCHIEDEKSSQIYIKKINAELQNLSNLVQIERRLH